MAKKRKPGTRGKARTGRSRVAKTASELDYYEYKFLVENRRLPLVLLFLKSLYGGTDPYPCNFVETIYYDTLDLKCYKDCLNGSLSKRKFRIRQYQGTDLIQAQVKQKYLLGVWKSKANFRGPVNKCVNRH